MDDDTDGLFDEPDVYEQDGPGLFGDDAVPVEESPDEPADATQEPDAPPVRDRPPVPDAPAAPLALYRRYRPDVFADIIGQEQVTEPLRRALLNNRVNHAYLFSGPRGCGKTSSARILARALNCGQGPTPDPCGECQSCRDLARGGPGSIDVIEIDAASHGGVDDARDLRERAFFAPVQSRFKIYIVDEAHMVTQAGFNALLKLVEEPPPHVKFIFATTEPEKVIGTIRSRTHHYPFRLVPPKILGAYLEKVCGQEGVSIEPGVIPLVVRAGAGSVRDSLSVLDQLLGAASETGVTYRQATGLLGFTPDSLLDEIIDAFAARDAGGVFAAVEKVIDAGQDPRRFTEDLLRRLRDLVIVASVPDAVSSGLIDVSDDQGERLTVQANGLGAGELTRAAEVLADGLVAMRGTTAPRLHLELMCARVLLPGVGTGDQTVHARLDRIERRLNMGGVGPDLPWTDVSLAAVPSGRTDADGSDGRDRRGGHAADAGAGSAHATRNDARSGAVGAGQGSAPGGSGTSTHAGSSGALVAGGTDTRSEPPDVGKTARVADARSRPPESGQTAHHEPSGDAAAHPGRAGGARPDRTGGPRAPEAGADVGAGRDRDDEAAASEAPVGQPAPPTRPGDLSVADVRRLWPQILDAVKGHRRFAWMVLSQHVQVSDLLGATLWLSFNNAGALERFGNTGCDDVLAEALVDVMGADLKIAKRMEGDPPPMGPRAGAQSGPSQTDRPVVRPSQGAADHGASHGTPSHGNPSHGSPSPGGSALSGSPDGAASDDASRDGEEEAVTGRAHRGTSQGDPGLTSRGAAAPDRPDAQEPPPDPWEDAPSDPYGLSDSGRPGDRPDTGAQTSDPVTDTQPSDRPTDTQPSADPTGRAAHPSSDAMLSPVAAAARLLRGFDDSAAADPLPRGSRDPRAAWPAEEPAGWTEPRDDSLAQSESSDAARARRLRHLRVVHPDSEPAEPVVDPDDPIIDDSGVDAEQLLRTVLNAEVIPE